MPLEKDILFEQQIFLGSQISQKHEEFKKIAKMSPDYADLYFFIMKMPEWEKETDETKILLEMIEIFGEIDLMRNTTELTRLSMIVGDTRKTHNVKRVMDELRQSGSHSTT